MNKKRGPLILKKKLTRTMKMTTWMTYQSNKQKSSTQEVLVVPYLLRLSDLGINELLSNQR